MTLRAGDIIARARFEHPAFQRTVAPVSVCANLLNRVQRELVMRAYQLNQWYLTSTYAVALLPGQDIAQLGAGEDQGAPLVEGTTTLARSSTDAGSLAEVASTAQILVSERKVSGAGSNSLIDSTAVMAVDAYVADVLVITAGPGVGQVREILSNTVDSFTITEAWEVNPTEESLYEVRFPGYAVDGSLGVQLGFSPPEGTRQGWLVKIGTDGMPYLDLAQPVQVQVSAGIPIPPNYQLNPSGVVRLARTPKGDGQQYPFRLINPVDALQPGGGFRGYVRGGRLFLAAPFVQWRDVSSIEVTYCPIPPAVTRAGDALLLPEDAEEALVAGITMGIALRALTLNVVGFKEVYAELKDRCEQMQGIWLAQVGNAGHGLAGTIQEVW